MSNKAKSSDALIPERRFSGFPDPWAYGPLSSVLRELKIKNSAGREVFSVSMESGIVNQIEHLGRSFAAADTSHYNVGHRFDVVYTKSPLKAFPFGIVKQCKFDGEVALSPLYGVFAPKNPHVGLMIEAYFEAPERAQAFLAPLCQKGAKNTLQITNATFLSGRMALPKEEGEQKKIAECLASMDTLIEAQERKVETLKAHKKGLMQQLFPQEGETQPRLRFPGFRDEWAERRLEELCKSISSGKDRAAPEGDFDLYGSTGIIGKTHSLSYSGTYILVARVGANSGLLTKAIGEFGVTDNTLIIVLKDTEHTDFVLYQLHQSGLSNMRFGSGQPLITGGQLKALSILVPEEEEQERIADCLTSLDDLIFAETQKLDKIKTHKKGLMQQLFPSADRFEQ